MFPPISMIQEKTPRVSDVLKIGYQIRDQLAKGQPVF
jgi:hypothetical protein